MIYAFPAEPLAFPPTTVKEEHATFRVLSPELLVCPAIVFSNLTPCASAAGNNGSRCRCCDGPGAGVAAGQPTPPISNALLLPPTSFPSPRSHQRWRRRRYPAAAQATMGAGAAAQRLRRAGAGVAAGPPTPQISDALIPSPPTTSFPSLLSHSRR
jgi:hypothetical protein